MIYNIVKKIKKIYKSAKKEKVPKSIANNHSKKIVNSLKNLKN